MFLSQEFLSQYGNYAPHQTPISTFTYLRTYSRFKPQLGRREHWIETCERAVNFSVSLEYKHRKKEGLPIDWQALVKEAENLFDSMFNLRQFLSGRTLWVGGAENALAEKFALANFNCSFTNVERIKDMEDIFYVLLVGTGAGLKAIPQLLKNFPKMNTKFKLNHKKYNYVGEPGKLEHSTVRRLKSGTAIITVGDSKEAWVQALGIFLTLLADTDFPVKKININYDYVRPAGARLKTFGGTASGPEPMMDMFEGFRKVLHNEIDTYLDPIVTDEDGFGQLRPIHIVDMANLIGYNVVVGGVRRTAEIILGDEDDYEFIFAKYAMNGLYGEEAFERHEEIGRLLELNNIPKPGWWDKVGTRHYNEGSDFPYNKGRHLPHRSMSNNSIAFTDKPTREKLNLVFAMMRGEGEPGFVNIRELAMKRFRQLGITNPSEHMIQAMMLQVGMNPCAEIDLLSKGVCNLTTIVVSEFVYNLNGTVVLDYDGLMKAQRMSARAGLRMTLIELELEEWDARQQADRLLGCSLTGWKDAMEELGYNTQQECDLLEDLRKVAREEADTYSAQLRVNTSLLVTTVKPEGTLSIVGNACSSGLHMSHSPYYIRRIRLNALDPLAKAVLELGWEVNPENFTPGDTHEERMANARTLVVSFPVKSGAKRTKFDSSVEEQLTTYFNFQKYYTEHNASNTINIKAEEGEWEKAEEIIFSRWDEFTAVSFLALDGGSYQQAPYEQITEEKYHEMMSAMAPFDMEVLQKHEVAQEFDVTDEDCSTGACPTR